MFFANLYDVFFLQDFFQVESLEVVEKLSLR